MIDLKLYSKRIREQRIRKGLTQRQLAAYAGISENAVANAEHGKTAGCVYTTESIADALGLSMDYLLGREEWQVMVPCEFMSPGQRIKMRRDQLGLFSIEVARRGHVSKECVRHLERSIFGTTANLCGVADALNVSVDWILGRAKKGQ